ncbi:hypothetical protein Esti_002044 [Eimeria stiedai]
MLGRLWGALSRATASACAAWGPSLRSARSGLGGPPRDHPRKGFGGSQEGASDDFLLADAAASLKRRLTAANERLGSWAVREAPPAFRLRGARYASYPGAPQRGAPRRGSLEQQKKANALSGVLLLFAACVVIGTPLYLNSFQRGVEEGTPFCRARAASPGHFCLSARAVHWSPLACDGALRRGLAECCLLEAEAPHPHRWFAGPPSRPLSMKMSVRRQEGPLMHLCRTYGQLNSQDAACGCFVLKATYSQQIIRATEQQQKQQQQQQQHRTAGPGS